MTRTRAAVAVLAVYAAVLTALTVGLVPAILAAVGIAAAVYYAPDR